MAPAFPAATAMTAAMVRAPTRWSTPVQPIRRKIVAVPISAAMVMPEIGLALTPISPVMREETTTKKNPKITISTAPSRLTASCGSMVRTSASTTAPTGVTQMGRSMIGPHPGGRVADAAAQVLEAGAEGGHDGRERADQRDDPGRAATAPAPM